jgi:hypothetical protein
MRSNWRIALAVALAVLVGERAASAQVGGSPAGDQTGGNTNGGLSEPAEESVMPKDPSATTVAPPRPSRVSSFDRVTTARRDVVSTPSQAGRAGGQGGTSAVGPYRARSVQVQPKGPKERVPTGSSWQQVPQRPTSPSPATVRSTTHDYYPGMRPGRQPNANRPQAARSGQRRSGMMGGSISGLGVNTGKAASSGQTATPRPGTAPPVAAPRR